MSDINYHERGCLTCRSPDCPVWQAADQNCWKSQADNDAQVAKKEGERVLDKYLDLLVSCRFELDGEIVVTMSAIRNIREEMRSEP